MRHARFLYTAALLAFASSAGAATICVSTASSCPNHTIQAGVAAATGSDVVVISPGVYNENVVVPAGKDGLTIQGSNKTSTFLDPDAPLAGVGLTIQSADVTVKNFTIRNGASHGIEITAAGAIITGMRFLDQAGLGVLVDATYANQQILVNEFRGDAGGGVALAGTNDGSIVKGNTMVGCGFGIEAFSANVQILSNKVTGGSIGIVAFGDTNTITGNTIEAPQQVLIASGKNPVVNTNKFIAGLQFGSVACSTCTGGSFTGNTVALTVVGPQLGADATGFVVTSNKFSSNAAAMIVSGTGIAGSLNTITGGAPLQPNLGCITLSGTGHNFSSNSVTCGSKGFYVAGDNITVNANKVLAADSAGILVDGNAGANTGATITNNSVSGVNGEAFAVINGATGTTLTGNVAAKSRLDYCDTTGATTASGNTFPDGTSTTCDILN